MAKEDFILRTTTNDPLTTKGSAISQVERDANWITIYNILVELSQSPNIATYNPGTTYDDTVNNYVMYNSQLWKYINVTPSVGTTPVEGVSWTAVYATNLSKKTKEYRASLNQTDIAPVASGEVSSIGTFTYGRIDVGVYTITKTGLFTNSNILFGAVKGFIEVTTIEDDTVTFKTYDTAGTLTDGILKNTGIIITLQ